MTDHQWPEPDKLRRIAAETRDDLPDNPGAQRIAARIDEWADVIERGESPFDTTTEETR